MVRCNHLVSWRSVEKACKLWCHYWLFCWGRVLTATESWIKQQHYSDIFVTFLNFCTASTLYSLFSNIYTWFELLLPYRPVWYLTWYTLWYFLNFQKYLQISRQRHIYTKFQCFVKSKKSFPQSYCLGPFSVLLGTIESKKS